MTVMGTWEGVIAIVGLTVLTVATRGFFFLTKREIPIPDWLSQGLRYARWQHQPPLPQSIALRPEQHQRQRAFGDGENAVARAMQNGEERCQHRASNEQGRHAHRMPQRRESRGQQRVYMP